MFNDTATIQEESIFTTRSILAMLVLDSLGLIGGYLLGPVFGLSRLYGITAGLVLASVILSVWLMMRVLETN